MIRTDSESKASVSLADESRQHLACLLPALRLMMTSVLEPALSSAQWCWLNAYRSGFFATASPSVVNAYSAACPGYTVFLRYRQVHLDRFFEPSHRGKGRLQPKGVYHAGAFENIALPTGLVPTFRAGSSHGGLHGLVL